MGEYAEMMLDGSCCEGCGEYIGDGDGFPQYCSSQCAKDRGMSESYVLEAFGEQKPILYKKMKALSKGDRVTLHDMFAVIIGRKTAKKTTLLKLKNTTTGEIIEKRFPNDKKVMMSCDDIINSSKF